LKGLKHIHDNNIVHSDIKPANIFTGKDGQVKIGDFGVSKKTVINGQALEGNCGSVILGNVTKN
jgi:serine/threonine protein kinase